MYYGRLTVLRTINSGLRTISCVLRTIWKAGGRPPEEMIIFMKQIDKERIGREFRETTEPVAETEAEADKRQWKAGGWSLEEVIIFMGKLMKKIRSRV